MGEGLACEALFFVAPPGLEAALDYAQTRKQFGKPIIENQGIQWMLADMAKDIQSARLLVYDAAARLDEGARATAACAMAKCFAGDIAVQHTANAVQIFGAAATSAASKSSGCIATPKSPRYTKAPTRSSAPSSPASWRRTEPCCETEMTAPSKARYDAQIDAGLTAIRRWLGQARGARPCCRDTGAEGGPIPSTSRPGWTAGC
jgi:hypothetical protein